MRSVVSLPAAGEKPIKDPGHHFHALTLKDGVSHVVCPDHRAHRLVQVFQRPQVVVLLAGDNPAQALVEGRGERWLSEQLLVRTRS